MKELFVLASVFLTSLGFAQTVGLQSFATGFTSPVEITHPVNDTRLFVVQQGGVIKIVNPDGTVNATPFLTLTSATISSGGERGLLGLAFHPNYATNGYFYVNYTNTSGNTVVARYTVSSTDANVADASSSSIVLTVNQPFSNHNGGTIKFGQDGYLYIGMGDGGGAGDTGNRAQNINENLGKMLRIDVDSASPYGIPPTNPYVGTAGNDEIWSIGMRNPWKFSFNRLNGDLWIADVGQSAAEEINKISSPLTPGLNFGWRCYEGNTAYDTSSGTCPSYAATVAPVTQYGHNGVRCSITGGYYYTGTAYPNFANNYFFADYCSGEIGMLSTAGTITWAYDAPNVITTFGEDKDGELYVAMGGTVYKIIDTSLNIHDFTKAGISFYPNPAKTNIYIQNNSDSILTNAKIHDLTGKLMAHVTLQSQEQTTLSVADLATGLYLLTVEDTVGNQYQSKLIVQ
jgi:glucose/arabinose dehydrogenase